jgi:hypothetical protein
MVAGSARWREAARLPWWRAGLERGAGDFCWIWSKEETDGRIHGWTLSGCCCVDSTTNRRAPQ